MCGYEIVKYSVRLQATGNQSRAQVSEGTLKEGEDKSEGSSNLTLSGEGGMSEGRPCSSTSWGMGPGFREGLASTISRKSIFVSDGGNGVRWNGSTELRGRKAKNNERKKEG